MKLSSEQYKEFKNYFYKGKVINMHKTIFTIEVPRSNKYPRRIKTHNEGVPINFVYQEKLTLEENHLVAAQGFVNDKGLDGSWIAGKVEKGFSWTNVQFNMFFDNEKCISNNLDINEEPK